MFNTPPYKTMRDGNVKTHNDQRAGLSGLTRPVRKSIELIERATTSKTPATSSTNKGDQNQTAESPSKNPAPITHQTPTKNIRQTTDTATVTKPKRYNITPTPIKTSIGDGAKYPSRAAEAAAMHKKGLENLGKFQNLRKDVKLEVKKALDRLYELTMTVSVARNLEVELNGDKGRSKRENTTQTESMKDGMERGINVRGKSNDEEWMKMRMEENYRILLENGRKMDELKEQIEGQRSLIEKATYAGVTAGRPSVDPGRDRTTLHSMVVTSRNEMDTGEEVLERIREAVDAKDGWVKVERVRKARDRKIVVACKTQEDRRRIKERIEKAGERLIVEEVKNRDPLVVLKGVLKIHNDDEIKRALRNQNREVFGDLNNEDNRMEVKYRRKTRNPHTNDVILEVSPRIWRAATEGRTLRVDLQRVRVEDHSPLVQCSRCLGYGHSRKFCKDEIDICSHCGGPHLGADCPDRIVGEAPECVNCRRANIVNNRHNAFSNECTVRMRWDRIARATVAYC